MNILTIMFLVLGVIGVAALIWFVVLHKKLSNIHQDIKAIISQVK